MSPYQPLSGIRILDGTRLLPGPFATMILADLGAQVDKLEDTHAGDYLRTMPPSLDDMMSPMFHTLNRGKRSISLDLKCDQGRKVFIKLLANYDVWIESYRPEAMEKLGLGYEQLRIHHPKLIHCAITGYGHTGPDKNAAGHDINYLARAGVLEMTGPVNRAPQISGVQMADITSGLYGVIGILAALRHASQSGEGKFVDISIVESSITLGILGYSAEQSGMHFPRGEALLSGGVAPYNTYMTKDGRAVALGALEPKFWSAFCAEVGLEYRFDALMPGPHQDNLKMQLTNIFLSKTFEEWTQISKQIDCCLTPVMTTEESMNDSQIKARSFWHDYTTSKKSTIQIPSTPVAKPAHGTAPQLGGESASILREAGFDEISIEEMIKNKVVRIDKST